MYIIHFIPLVTSILNFLLTDILFLKSHAYYLVYVAVGYSMINFAATKAKGEPIYFFLTWEDYDSVLIVFGIMCFAYLLFYSLAWGSESLKNRTTMPDNKKLKRR